MAIKADDVKAAPVQKAIAELKQQALASGEMHTPIDVDINGDNTVAKIEIPLAGNGIDAARPMRSRRCGTRCCHRPSARSTASSTP